MIELLPPAEFPGDSRGATTRPCPSRSRARTARPTTSSALRRRGARARHRRDHRRGAQPLRRETAAAAASTATASGDGGIYFYTDGRAATPLGPRARLRPARGAQLTSPTTRSMWLAEYRSDGLRWDSTINIRATAGRERANADGWTLLRERQRRRARAVPHKLQIAEDSAERRRHVAADGQAAAPASTRSGTPRSSTPSTTTSSRRRRRAHMAAVRGAHRPRLQRRPTQRVIYTESHDEVANGKSRIPEMISPGRRRQLAARKRSTLGAAIVPDLARHPDALHGPGVPRERLLRRHDAARLDQGDHLRRHPAALHGPHPPAPQRRRQHARPHRRQRRVFHVNDTAPR